MLSFYVLSVITGSAASGMLCSGAGGFAHAHNASNKKIVKIHDNFFTSNLPKHVFFLAFSQYITSIPKTQRER